MTELLGSKRTPEPLNIAGYWAIRTSTTWLISRHHPDHNFAGTSYEIYKTWHPSADSVPNMGGLIERREASFVIKAYNQEKRATLIEIAKNFAFWDTYNPDNIFGVLGRGDGFTRDSNGEVLNTNAYANGSIQHAFPMPNTCQLSQRPSQEWLASHNAYDNGMNAGFVRTQISPTIPEIVGGVAMGYYTSDHLPCTYSLAEEFPIGDRNLTAGYAPTGTIFNELDKHNISWTNYAPDCCWTTVSGNTPDFYGANDYDTESQENPQTVLIGEALLASVVDAIGKSPLWLKTLFILSYDEHGGYYDHVPPPPALMPDDITPIVLPGEYQYDGFARLGFRVPVVVVFPYAKPGKSVSHVVHDHTSVLAALQRKWNLRSFTYRDANANDMLDFLDLEALERKEQTFRTMPPLAAPGNTTEALACSETGAGVIPPPGTVSSQKLRRAYYSYWSRACGTN
ncbi:phosphoesterase family-domain-containing protein [Lipomyces kononenkoae]|uniref:Phosphoesterase family-domain-containing protein n=1 Tax=Lipomyces kononenkoae TaxID=34357 RepID=A0ACC3SRD6_LIPKO